MSGELVPWLYGQRFAVAHFNDYGDQHEPAAGPEDANVVTSMVHEEPYRHRVVLDVDMPVSVVPSSTAGHHHLLIDKELSWPDYVKLLRVLAEVGIVEPGYVAASEARGYTSVRLPWVRK